MKFSYKKPLALVTAATAAAVQTVQAAVPAAVTTAISEMQADAVIIAGVVLVAIIAVMAVKFLRKGM